MDLKPYYDAVNTANADVQRVAHAIDALFNEGSEESKQKALEMRAALDDAQKKADDAAALYDALKKANRASTVAENFVPTSTAAAAAAEQPSVMKRAEFEKMTPKERMAFAKANGMLED